MKYLLPFLLTTLLFSSCATQMIQVFDTSASNTKPMDSSWVYENDTIKIIYDFWTDKGMMSFSVYNKIDKPIYIDWKNSSFIYNGNKLDYWVEEEKNYQNSSGFYYKGLLSQNSASTTVKPEKITFIPPHSTYDRIPKFILQPSLFKVKHKKENVITVQSNLDAKKVDTIYQQKFDYSTTPLKFRNYLAISFSESSQTYQFVDNEFYLSTVTEMKYQTFKGMPIGYDTHKPLYGKSPYQSQTSFFIEFKEGQ